MQPSDEPDVLDKLEFLLRTRGIQIDALVELLTEAGIFDRDKFYERMEAIETRYWENEENLRQKKREFRRKEEIQKSFEKIGDDDSNLPM
jgi:hypothetical protein